MGINELNTNYILDNISLNMIKINDLQNTDFSPNAEKIIYDSIDTSTPVLSQKLMNFNDTIGYLQTADNSLSNLSNLADTLSNLNSELNDPNITNEQKTNIEQESQNIQKNISNVLQNTTYDNEPIFGNNLEVGDKTIDLGISTDNLDLTNPNKLKEFKNAINNTKDDIDVFLNHSNDTLNNMDLQDLGIDFDNNNQNFNINNSFDFLNNIESNQLTENAYLIAMAHNKDYLSQNITQLLSI